MKRINWKIAAAVILPVLILAANCNSRFAYISKLSWQFGRRIYGKGYLLIYQDDEGYPFDPHTGKIESRELFSGI